MIALIDGDIVVYRVGYTTNDDPVEIAYARANEMIEQILADVQAEEYKVYLSDNTKNGFRYHIYPEYKANRTQPKPVHYQALRDYLVSNWNAEITQGQEADDALGIEQWKHIGYSDLGLENYDSSICSIDKDLLQIPGNHYNFVTKSFSFITEEQGLYHFYKQLLMGDVADNIQGIRGIGIKKAEKLLGTPGDKTEAEMYAIVHQAYRDWLSGEWDYEEWGEFQEHQVDNIITVNGQLLKIRTTEGELWKPPTLDIEVGTELLS